MTSDTRYLEQHRLVWARKPVLRRLYREQFYLPLLKQRAAGERTLEIGSGTGLLQDIDPTVWRTDILPSPHIHCAADVHTLPFAAGSFDTVIGLDVLHHLNRPVTALREIARVLRPGGRCAFIEPWITPFSRFVYTYFHQESCDITVQPWREDELQFDPTKQAFDGNAAIPYRLVMDGRTQLERALPQLRLMRVHPFSLLTYLLSLGFKRGSLLPALAYDPLWRIEQVTQPIWVKAAALRALIIWERHA